MPPKNKKRGGSTAAVGSKTSQGPAKKGARAKKEAPRRNLHDAASGGDVNEVRSLLAAGANVNETREYKIYEYSPNNSLNVTPLACSVAFNHPDVSQILLDSGADLRPPTHPTTQRPWPVLHIAIYQATLTKTVAIVDVLLRSERCDVNEEYMGRSVLHEAVSGRYALNGDTTLLRRLLEEPGLEIDNDLDLDMFEETPVHTAVSWRFTAAVEALLQRGADPRALAAIYIPDDDQDVPPELGEPDGMLEGFEPLHTAAYDSAADSVAPLVAAGADVDARCFDGYPPLTIAILCAQRTHPTSMHATVEALLDCGADPNAKRLSNDPSERYAPLYYALREGDRELCEMLLEAGADAAQAAPSISQLAAAVTALPDHIFYHPDQSVFPETILMRLKVLHREGVDLSATTAPGPPGSDGELLLHQVAELGADAAVLFLVSNGADATARDSQGRTPLQLLMNAAAEPGGRRVDVETVAALVVAGDLDSWDSFPAEYEGLECLLGFLQATAPQHLGAFFKTLTHDAQARVRETLCVLHRGVPGGGGMEQIRMKILAQAFGGERHSASVGGE